MDGAQFEIGQWVRYDASERGAWKARWRRGTVAGLTKTCVRIQNGPEIETIRRGRVEIMTPHQIDVMRWQRSKPATETVVASIDRDRDTVTMDFRRSAIEDIDAVMTDLTAIRDWYARRPVRP